MGEKRQGECTLYVVDEQTGKTSAIEFMDVEFSTDFDSQPRPPLTNLSEFSFTLSGEAKCNFWQSRRVKRLLRPPMLVRLVLSRWFRFMPWKWRMLCVRKMLKDGRVEIYAKPSSK